MPIANSQALKTVLTHPLSDSQRELWFAAQLSDAASAAFNQSFVLEFKGDLEHGALSDALDDLVARHDALRTTFSSVGDEQRVHDDLPLFCPLVDFSGCEANEQSESLQTRLRLEGLAPFNLTKGPMIRAVLIKLASARHLLVLTVHHLICDGTSLNLLVEELAELYSARKTGAKISEAPPMQFSQFVAGQRDAGSRRAEAEQYWLAQFQKPAPFLELPFDNPRPNVRTFNGARGWLTLDTAVAQHFTRLAAKNRSTLFAASLAAFYVLLHRLTGQTDLVVGVPMSARVAEGSHEVAGHCVNFLPLRLSVAGNPTFTEHLTNVRRMLLDALEHGNYNFGSLIQKLNLPRHPTCAPLVSTMFNVDHIREALQFEGLEAGMRPNPFCLANFDFSLSLEDRDGRLQARCIYASDMLESTTVARWLQHLQTLLGSIVANPQCRIGELPLLTEFEQKMIVDCSDTEEHLIRDLLPPELVSAMPSGAPDLQLYVLDSYGQFALPGVAGELCVAGLPLAHGMMSEEKFVNSPYPEHNGRLMIRTGYKAKYLPNADIEMLDPVKPRDSDAAGVGAPLEEPQSVVLKELTDIWREVMRLDAIEPHDDFFDLGGHSLLVSQIVGRVRNVFGVQLSLRDFFDAPTVAGLGALIETRVLGEVEQTAMGT